METKYYNFNTGAPYTPEGQIILASAERLTNEPDEFGDHTYRVTWFDVSRLVTGQVDMLAPEAPGAARIARRYLDGGYRDLYSGHDDIRALEEQARKLERVNITL